MEGGGRVSQGGGQAGRELGLHRHASLPQVPRTRRPRANAELTKPNIWCSMQWMVKEDTEKIFLFNYVDKILKFTSFTFILADINRAG